MGQKLAQRLTQRCSYSWRSTLRRSVDLENSNSNVQFQVHTRSPSNTRNQKNHNLYWTLQNKIDIQEIKLCCIFYLSSRLVSPTPDVRPEVSYMPQLRLNLPWPSHFKLTWYVQTWNFMLNVHKRPSDQVKYPHKLKPYIVENIDESGFFKGTLSPKLSFSMLYRSIYWLMCDES